jgi:hypothetical protein
VTNHPVRDDWFDLVEGSLGAADAERLRAHAAGCDACRAALARIEAAHRASEVAGHALADASAGAEPSPELDARVLAAARAAKSSGPAETRRRRRTPGAWFATAAALAAGLLAVVLWRGHGHRHGAGPFGGALAIVAERGGSAGEMRDAGPTASEGAAVAAELERAVADGRVRLQTAPPPACVAGEQGRGALVDRNGRIRAFFLAVDGTFEVHLYRGDGRPAGAFRIDQAGRATRVPGLNPDTVRAATAGPACGPLRDR